MSPLTGLCGDLKTLQDNMLSWTLPTPVHVALPSALLLAWAIIVAVAAVPRIRPADGGAGPGR